MEGEESSNKTYAVIFVFSVLLALVVGFILANYMSDKQTKQLSQEVADMKSQLSSAIVQQINYTVENNKDSWKLESFQRDIAYLNYRVSLLQGDIKETLDNSTIIVRHHHGGGSSPTPGY
jgi:mannitol-specific phosphotransferase system IIBC component